MKRRGEARRGKMDIIIFVVVVVGSILRLSFHLSSFLSHHTHTW